ncbi:MAG: hypothetical protein SGCHY_000527 [Lobulomycetales sp.]
MNMDAEKTYILNDAMVHESELELLSGTNWINDSLIHFHSELLSSSASEKNSCCFLAPSIVLLLETYLDISLGPPDLQNAEAIFIPVNDNKDLDSPGGSHWSLLVYHNQSFYYYDSLNTTGKSKQKTRAREIAVAFSKILHLKGDPTMVKVESPVQLNYYDCGVYVMYMSKLLASRIQENSHDHKIGNLAM